MVAQQAVGGVARWGWGPRSLLPGQQVHVACGSGAWETPGSGALAGLVQSSLGPGACWVLGRHWPVADGITTRLCLHSWFEELTFWAWCLLPLAGVGAGAVQRTGPDSL